MLSGVKLFALDLDGVVYRGEQVLPGASSFVERVRALGKGLVFVTNSTLRPRAYYAEKLVRLGISVQPQEIFTAAYATGRYLKSVFNGYSPSLFLLGEDGLVEEFRELSPRFLSPSDDEVADAVVVGLDRDITYYKLCKAVRDIMAGARFIGVNGDPLWPVEEGFMPGVGVFLSAIKEATGINPLIVGKPSTYMLEMAMAAYGCDPSEVFMIGDKLDSDILMGRSAGVRTALVLSGVTSPQELKRCQEEAKPHIVAGDLAHLEKILLHSM